MVGRGPKIDLEVFVWCLDTSWNVMGFMKTWLPVCFSQDILARSCRGCGDMEGWRKGGIWLWKRRSLVSPQKGSNVIEQEPSDPGVKGSKKCLRFFLLFWSWKNPAISAFPSLWTLNTLSAQEIFSLYRILPHLFIDTSEMGCVFFVVVSRTRFSVPSGMASFQITVASLYHFIILSVSPWSPVWLSILVQGHPHVCMSLTLGRKLLGDRDQVEFTLHLQF